MDPWKGRIKSTICLAAIASVLISSTAGVRITLTPNELPPKKTGDQFAIRCQLDDVSEQGDVSPVWVKVSKDEEVEQIATSGRVFTRRSDGNSILLIINDAKLSDAGEYKCSGGGLSASVTVKLHRSISFVDSPEEQHPHDGTDAVIRCRADGDPKPLISWSKGDSPIAINGGRYTSEEGDLKIPSFRAEEDNGEYTCTAVQVETGSMKDLKISVAGYIHPSAANVALVDAENWPNGIYEDATDIRISCASTGVPTPTFRWTKDGIELHDDGHYTTPRSGTLQITRINSSDDGVYTCIAVNAVGESPSSGLKLDVFKKAKILSVKGPEQAKVGEDATLECEFEGSEPVEAVWINLGNVIPSLEEGEDTETKRNGKYVVHSNNNAIVYLKNVTLTDAGEYQCRVSNEAGTATDSLNLQVQRSPLIVKFTAGAKVRAVLNSIYDLHCVAYAVPSATITWWKDDMQLTPEEGRLEIVSDSGQDSNHVESTLKMTVTSEQDFGDYICKAESSLEPAAAKTIALLKMEPPMHPQPVCHDARPTVITLMITAFSSSQEEKNWPDDIDIHVYRREDNSFVTTAALKFDASGLYKIPNLDPSSAYIFNVTGKNQAGPSSSEVIDCETPVPAPPGKPVFSHEGQLRCNSTSQCPLSWTLDDTGGKRIEGYKLQYRPLPEEGDGEQPVWIPSETQSYTFSDLQPRTVYEVRLWAKNEEGFGDVAVTNMTVPEKSVKQTADVFIAGEGSSAGAVVATVIVIVLLIVILVDVACYYFNQCGLLMTICVNFCGKAPPEPKGKESKEAMMEGGGGKETIFDEAYEQKQPVKSEQFAVAVERGDVDATNESTPMIGQNGHKEKRDTVV